MDDTIDDKPLTGRIALVAGATRGAGRGIAVELGAAGATVYCTGRTTRTTRSDYDRPETIEDTAELVGQAGGSGIAVAVDHLDPAQVAALVERIDAEHGRLDILINDCGGAPYLEFHKPLWEQDLDKGLRMLRSGLETHVITSHHALRLLIRHPGGLVVEVGDGTDEYNATRYRASGFYDLVKTAVNRFAFIQAEELRNHGCTAVAVTPGWLRSEMMLDIYQVSEDNWRDATRPRGGDAPHNPGFGSSETPRYVGRGIAALAADPERARWNQRSVTVADLAAEYGFTDVDGSRPDGWRYTIDDEAGTATDIADYR
jgi:NAD(P)-dependent dehydrogenase (short-subunit alcohol dehydrogenase family)